MTIGAYAADGSLRVTLTTGAGVTAPDGSTIVTLTSGAGVNYAYTFTALGTGVLTALGVAVTGSGSIALSASPTFTGTVTCSTLSASSTVVGQGVYSNLYVYATSVLQSGLFTVATLPAAPTGGERGFVTDALGPVFGSVVVGGGAVKIPVYSDGTNWRVG